MAKDTTKPNPNDPIEGAKNTGTDDTGGAGPGAAGVGASPPEPAVTPLAKAKPKKAAVYEVQGANKWTGSWRGQEVRFNPGERISEDSYGDGAIENFKNGGLSLKLVEE